MAERPEWPEASPGLQMARFGRALLSNLADTSISIEGLAEAAPCRRGGLRWTSTGLDGESTFPGPKLINLNLARTWAPRARLWTVRFASPICGRLVLPPFQGCARSIGSQAQPSAQGLRQRKREPNPASWRRRGAGGETEEMHVRVPQASGGARLGARLGREGRRGWRRAASRARAGGTGAMLVRQQSGGSDSATGSKLNTPAGRRSNRSWADMEPLGRGAVGGPTSVELVEKYSGSAAPWQSSRVQSERTRRGRSPEAVTPRMGKIRLVVGRGLCEIACAQQRRHRARASVQLPTSPLSLSNHWCWPPPVRLSASAWG